MAAICYSTPFEYPAYLRQASERESHYSASGLPLSACDETCNARIAKRSLYGVISADSWLVWAARKLASQPVGYLPTRLFASIRKVWVAKVFPTPGMLRSATLTLPDNEGQCDIRRYFLERSAPRWLWDLDDISRIVASIPHERISRTVQQAELILNNEFTFRGRSPVRLSKGQWTPEGVSLGWIWDLNRHHWFATLGFAFWYTGDVRFLHAFIYQSSDWMQQFLDRIGRIEWDTPFEVASRLNAWLWAYFLFVTAENWPSTHHKKFLDGLGLMAEYLSHSLEYHCPGNHIILEAKTLALISEVFPEFKGSSQWRSKGRRIVWRELDRQICSDGVHAERSTMYHRIVAGELAELWYHYRKNRVENANVIGAVVEKMAEFQAWIDQGAGQMPLLGDAHLEDTYYRFCAPALVDVGAQNVAHLLESEFTEHTSWLLAAQKIGVTQTPRTAMPAGRAFPDGGYFVARSDWSRDADVVTWDCGPIGFDPNRKHAHLDSLAFTLSSTGTPIIIDPGTHEDRSRWPSLRRTGAHNTIRIDGEDQGILARRDEIWSPPRARLHLWASSNECTVMAGSQDGYRRLPNPVDVMRTILVMHGLYVLVIDSVRGAGNHRIEQPFHLAPGSSVEEDLHRRSVKIVNGRATVNMSWAGEIADGLKSVHPAAPEIEISSGVAEMFCGRPEDMTVVCATVSDSVPADIAVVIASRPNPLDIRWVQDMGTSQWMNVTDGTFEHRIYLDIATRTPARLPGHWQTNSWFAIVRRASKAAGQDLLVPSSSQIWRLDREKCEESVFTGGFRKVLVEDNGQ